MNRHRKPSSTVGVKILPAGALGSAAVMATHHPDAATRATLNQGLPQNNTNSSVASTSINRLDIPSSTGLPSLGQVTHGNPNGSIGITFPIQPDGSIGNPFASFNFNFLPELIPGQPNTGVVVNSVARRQHAEPGFHSPRRSDAPGADRLGPVQLTGTRYGQLTQMSLDDPTGPIGT